MNSATRSAWKSLPPPKIREALLFEGVFSDAEYRLIQKGIIPQAMEDKWFVFLEDGSVHFHRSWTGAEIYCLRLQQEGADWRVVDSWVNRDPEQYKALDLAYDRELLRFLIDGLILHKSGTRFPLPPGSDAAPKGVVQHHLVGRAFAEKPARDDE